MAKRWKQRVVSALFGMMLGLTVPALVIAPVIPVHAADATLLPNAKQQYLDDAGNPVASGSVGYYIPSTTTKKTVWQDATKTTPQTNPVPLDAAGRPQPAGQTYGDGTYRQQVKDANNEVIWDAIVTSTGSGGGGSVTPTVGDGNIVGTILPWAGLVAPPNYVFAYGQLLLRASYPLFFATITNTTNVICTSGLNILSGIADTQNIRLGSPVEASCIPPGTQVTAKSPTSVTLTAAAAISTVATATFFPWVNGDGSTSFNVPDFRGQALVGRNNMGGTASTALNTQFFGVGFGSTPNALGAPGGNQSIALVNGNLPPYTPAGTIANGAITNTVTGGVNGSTSTSTTVSASGVQLLSGSTAIVVGSSQASSVFTGTAAGGTSIPISLVQPSVTTNYIIKVLPDVSTAVATGVASLGGMTGALACGVGLNCSANTITNTVVPIPAFSPSIAIEAAGGDCGLADNTAALLTAAASAGGASVRVVFQNNCTYNFTQANALVFATNVFLQCNSPTATKLAYNPTADGTFLKWANGVSVIYAAGGAGIDGCTITTTDTTHTKVFVEPNDVSGFRFTNSSIGWPNGAATGGTGSVCLRTKGRETHKYDNLSLQCDRPLQISMNPNAAGGVDHFHFANMYLLPSAGFPAVTVDRGVVFSDTTFDGFQAWAGGTDGFSYVDTAAAHQVVSVGTAGSGYTVGQVVALSGGTCSTAISVRVLTINGSGGLLSAAIADPGVCSVTPSNPVSLASGGATVNVQLIAGYRLSLVNVRTEQGTGGAGSYSYNIQTTGGLQGLTIANSVMDSARCGIFLKGTRFASIRESTYYVSGLTCAVNATSANSNDALSYYQDWWVGAAAQVVTGLTNNYGITGPVAYSSTTIPANAYYTVVPIAMTFGLVTAGTFNNVVITPPASTASLTLASAKSFIVNNSMTMTATDGAAVNFGTGGTVAYVAGGAGAPLTKGDDTNVTLTLGGSPTIALVNAASITAGWTGTLANARLAPMATNTVKGNATSGTASPTDLAVGSCDTATKALQWTTNTGFGCNSAITATTNANLTGAVTSVGNATSLGSFTSAQLAGALTNETGTGLAVFGTDPTFSNGIVVANNVGAGTFNNVGISSLGSTASIAVGSGKTFTASNTMTLNGTDSTTMTFPTTSATLARTDAAQTFTGVQTFSSTIVGSVNGNAATVTTNANLTGAVTSVGNATTLGSFSSANLRTALTDETGTGAAYFQGGDIGTPSAGVGTNITGVNAATLGGATFAAPGAIGGTTPAAITGTTITGNTSVTSPFHNATGASGYQLSGATALGIISTNFVALSDTTGTNKMFFGNASVSNANTYLGDTHLFKNAANTVTFLNITGGGATIQMPNLASDAAQVDSTVCINSSGTLLKGSGTLGICLGTSSARFKHDIVPMGASLAELVRLAPKNFFYNKGFGDGGARQQYGFIAEDVVKVLPGVTAAGPDGKVQSVDMVAMIPVLVNAVKQLKADNDNLRMDVLALRAKVSGGKK